MIPNIVIPACPECQTTVASMELLSIHMKDVRRETDNNRITRLTETFTPALKREPKESENKFHLKIFDCSECGKLFDESEELKIHNNEHHASKLLSLNEFEKTLT